MVFVTVESTVLVDLMVVVFVAGAGVMVVVDVEAFPVTVLRTVVVEAGRVVCTVVVLSALLTEVTVWTERVVVLVLETIL